MIRNRTWTEMEIFSLRKLYSNKIDINEICSILKRTKNSIHKKASELKLNGNKLKFEHIKKEDIFDFYVNQNLPPSRIAKILNIDKCSVNYLIRKYNMPIKDISNRTQNVIRDRGDKCKWWTGHENISGSYFNSVKKSARERNIEFNITIEDMWNQFIKQDGKCKYTNIDLILVPSNSDRIEGLEQTASLDRIDSLKGYTIDNIQWVLKKVNFMKINMNEKEFIELCKRIAENN